MIEEPEQAPLYARSIELILADLTLLKWSPNGRYLAFTAALENTGTYIYVYDVEQDNIRRLTNGHHLAMVKSWSPDSEWIVYGDASGYYIDAPTTIDEGIWVASIQGDWARELYQAPIHFERLVGWTSNNTFMVERMHFETPSGSLREVNARTGYIQTLYQDRVNTAILASGRGITLLDIGGMPFWPPEMEAGIYRLSNTGDPQLPLSGAYSLIEWHPEIEKFVAQNDENGLVAFTSEGEILFKIDDARRLHPSPDGKWLLAEDHNGLGIFDEQAKLVESFEYSGYKKSILWLPDSTGFFLTLCKHRSTNSGSLYLYEADRHWEVLIVDEATKCAPEPTLIRP